MQQQKGQSQLPGDKSGKQFLAFTMQSLSTSIEVFLRTDVGERYLGMQAALVVPMVLLFTGLFRGQDAGPMLLFLIAYLFMCVYARIGIIRRRRSGGVQCHTRYTGRSRLARVLPRLSEMAVKRIEAVLVFGIGMLMLPMCQMLGAYLMLAAFAMFSCLGLGDAYDRNRALDIHDAVIDQKAVAERFQDVHGQ